MLGHTTPRPAPSWGTTTGGQQDLGQAAQGQGPCWVNPLACGTSEQNRPSPSGRLPWLIPKPGFQARLLAVPRSRTLCSQAREKSALGWSDLKALGPEPGEKPGGPVSQANSEAHAKVCSCPLHIQRARLKQRLSGSSLASQETCPGARGRAVLGAHWACCSPCCPVDAGTKWSWPSTPFLPSSL